MEAVGDVLVLPFLGQGHLFPCVELCRHFSSHKIRSILIIPSQLSSSIPNSLHHQPLVEVLQVPASYSPLPPPPPRTEIVAESPPDIPQEGSRSGTGQGPRPVHHHQQLGHGIESFISERYKKNVPGRIRPHCVVMDVMMSWSKEIFTRENIPIVAFFTSGACSAAMGHAAWKARVDEMGPDETRILSGLPESIALSYSDLKRRDHRWPGHGGGKGGPPRGMNFGPPRPGQPPRWLDEAEGSEALLINTCDDLEGPFLEYLAGQTGKPVFGVGPLLPEKYWKSTGPVLHDQDIRPNRESNCTEDEVIQWLDSKPSRSVIYVSFGSEVGPTLEEYDQLAEALEESNRPFVWIIQPGAGRHGPPSNFFGGKTESAATEEGYYPHGLEERLRDRGLLIRGWAPQLLILSHQSIGGFLSHCGWNSTLEAVGRAVPILAWPIRGDQFYNAKLVVKYLKMGHMVSSGDDLAEIVKKSDIVGGIKKLMDDGEVHDRGFTLSRIFEAGYPLSSAAALKALIGFISM